MPVVTAMLLAPPGGNLPSDHLSIICSACYYVPHVPPVFSPSFDASSKLDELFVWWSLAKNDSRREAQQTSRA